MHVEKAIKKWRTHFRRHHAVKKKKCKFNDCNFEGTADEITEHMAVHPKKCPICENDILRGTYRKIVGKEGKAWSKKKGIYENYVNHYNTCRNKHRNGHSKFWIKISRRGL